MNDLPVLDPKPLRSLLDLGAEPALIQELIALLQEDVPIRLAALRTALAASDAQQTMREAHQLKGALGNLGLVRFADLVSRLEACAAEGSLEGATLLDEALPMAYDEALRALVAAYPQA